MRDVARRLGLSAKTVGTYRTGPLEKVGGLEGRPCAVRRHA